LGNSESRGVVKLLNLINGYLRIQRKLEQIQANIKPLLRHPALFINQENVNTSSLLDSRWLVGFTDSVGCFYIQTLEPRDMVSSKGQARKKAQEVRLHLKFSLKDRAILEQFRLTYGNSVGTREQANGLVTYYWSTSTFSAALLVRNYFDTSSLQSTKLFNFIKWRDTLKNVESHAHLRAEGFEKIKALKNGMNTGANILR
jgi:hypothetical protein